MPALSHRVIHFPPFQLDTAEKCLWRNAERLALTPKDYAVLHHLLLHAHQLVTLENLLQSAWPREVVAPGAVKVRLRRLRQLLGDDAVSPRFIETVRGYGYRFIGEVSPDSELHSEDAQSPERSLLVGRESVLSALHSLRHQAANGERQVVFVTGEPGIGKTAVIDAFVDAAKRQDSNLLVACGQCIEHHGVGEAYLSVLEALYRLCRSNTVPSFLPLMRRHAPTWLMQMPSLLKANELAELKRVASGTAQQRMMREIADALEALTDRHMLVLCLEDVHWADYSTLDLIHYLALRRDRARLLVLATYRHSEIHGNGPALGAITQELHARRQCTELSLALLTAKNVAEYLHSRFALTSDSTDVLAEIARVIHHTTEGNPLFMVNMVNALVAQQKIRRIEESWQVIANPTEIDLGVPDNLRQLIEKQIEQLSEIDRGVLEAASVTGAEFSTAAVAAALDLSPELADQHCAGLARRGAFLRALEAVTLPNGQIAGRYGFLHALYQKVLYERQPEAKRMRCHLCLGQSGELAFGERAGEIAAELARHFEQSHEFLRAAHYLGLAAQNALRRSANREAIEHLAKGIDILRHVPDSNTRDRLELELQTALAVPLMMTKGNTAVEVKHAYRRARELCTKVGETPLLFPVLVGLGRFGYGWDSVTDSATLREQIMQLAQQASEPAKSLVAHMMLGGNAFFRGDFTKATMHSTRGLAGYEPLEHRTLIYLYGDDPRVLCLCWLALAQWYLGYPDQARTRIADALDAALDLAHPYGVAFARFWQAFIEQACGDIRKVKAQTVELLALAESHSIPQFEAMGTILHGWSFANLGKETEGLAEIRKGIDALKATRQELGRPYFAALLADSLRNAGKTIESIALLDDVIAHAAKTGECMHLAELHRLRGELKLVSIHDPLMSKGHESSESNQHLVAVQVSEDAAACFSEALTIARKQQAKSLELRAAMSLVRLREQLMRTSSHSQSQARAEFETALRQLRSVCDWFSEGFDTADLCAARSLLDAY